MKDNLAQMETRIAAFKDDLKIASKDEGEASSRLTKLMEQVMDAEKRERDLKDRVFDLENVDRELQLRLMEAKKANFSAENDLQDQERLVQNLGQLQTENRELGEQVAR